MKCQALCSGKHSGENFIMPPTSKLEGHIAFGNLSVQTCLSCQKDVSKCLC